SSRVPSRSKIASKSVAGGDHRGSGRAAAEQTGFELFVPAGAARAALARVESGRGQVEAIDLIRLAEGALEVALTVRHRSDTSRTGWAVDRTVEIVDIRGG